MYVHNIYLSTYVYMQGKLTPFSWIWQFKFIIVYYPNKIKLSEDKKKKKNRKWTNNIILICVYSDLASKFILSFLNKIQYSNSDINRDTDITYLSIPPHSNK